MRLNEGIAVAMLAMILLLCIIAACNSKQERNETKEVSTEEVVISDSGIVNFEYGNCADSAGYCARFFLDYSELQSLDSELRGVIGNSIISKIAATYIDSCMAENLALFAECQGREFSAAYEEFVGTFPDVRQRWFDSTGISIVFESDKLISIQSYRFSYTGGAHPNTWTYFFNFNRGTLSQFTLSDLIAPDCGERFRAEAERNFRSTVGIGPDEPLDGAGLWFPDGLFDVPDNFILTDSTITFLYNPYEVAPYSSGSISFSMNKATLGSCIKF